MKLWLICFWGLFLAAQGWQWLGLKMPAELFSSLAVGLAGIGLAIASNRQPVQRLDQPSDPATQPTAPAAPSAPSPAQGSPAAPAPRSALSFEIRRKPHPVSRPAPVPPEQK